MSIKHSNKYWQEVDEMEEFSLKIDFYNMLFTNINNEEIEARAKADEFYWDNHNKHIYANPKKYLDTIKKAVKADAEKTGEEYIVYSASGVGGQKIYVIPDLDIVIAAVSRTSLVKDNSYVLNDVIGKFILPSVKF